MQQELNEIGEPDIRISPSTENTFKKLRMSSHAIIPSPLPKRRDAIRQSLASDSRYCRYYRSVSRTAWKCKSQIPISTTARAERGVGPTHFTNMTRRSATAELRSVSSIIHHQSSIPSACGRRDRDKLGRLALAAAFVQDARAGCSARTFVIASGMASYSRNRFMAGPVGVRRPCSQS